MRLIYYTETNLICIVIVLFTMYYMNSLTSRNETSTRIFVDMLRLLIVFCISDIAAVILSGNVFPGSWWLSQIVNAIYFLIPVILAFLWFLYIQVRLRKTSDFKSIHFIKKLPVIIGCITILLNPWTNFYFSIDSSNLYHRGPGVIFHWIICWFYFLWTLGQVIVALKKETNEFKREEYRNYSLFIFPIAITALTQMFVYGVTSSQLGFVFATALVFFSTQQTLVHKDELTGLNNRNSLIAFKNSLFQSIADHDIVIIMTDINHFKSINDRFGHLTGDDALRHCSAALLRAASGIKTTRFLLYRYGGDEFVFIGIRAKEEEINQLITNIKVETAKENELIDADYTLSLSVGLSRNNCKSVNDFNELFKQADNDMYLNKKK